MPKVYYNNEQLNLGKEEYTFLNSIEELEASSDLDNAIGTPALYNALNQEALAVKNSMKNLFIRQNIALPSASYKANATTTGTYQAGPRTGYILIGAFLNNAASMSIRLRHLSVNDRTNGIIYYVLKNSSSSAITCTPSFRLLWVKTSTWTS